MDRSDGARGAAAGGRAGDATVPPGRRVALHVVPPPARRPSGVVKAASGVAELIGLPDGPLTLKALVGDATYAVPHDGASDVARLVVPAHGRVEVSFATRSRAELRDVRLRFFALDGDGRVVRDVPLFGYDEARGVLAVETLLAGRYRVEARRCSERDVQPSEFAPAVEFEVPARGSAAVRIDG